MKTKFTSFSSRIVLLLTAGLILGISVASVAGQESASNSNTATEVEKNLSEAATKTAKTNFNAIEIKKETTQQTERERQLLERVEQLEREVKELGQLKQQLDELKLSLAALKTGDGSNHNALVTSDKIVAPINATETSVASKTDNANKQTSRQISDEDRGTLDFLRDTTINFSIDGYYGYNFNRPYNRLNLLRAYAVSSNSFSLNQANLVIENAPNLKQNKRFGLRLDLQYGQATETLQGNPNNELRPQVYRPVWQAYGTYVAPIGKGLTVDFGKWASSLGYETNYNKDNFNYSRSYFFNYLPYYHFGVRAAYPVTKKLTATYWLVNGTQQSEDFNESKSQAILLTYKPTDKVILQGNYYVGREQRDQALAEATTVLTSDVTRGRITPKGRFHVLDVYATVLLSDKTTFAFEGDYVINRVNRRDAPSRVTGGVVYLRHQFTSKFAVAERTEYLSDRGGLFSNTTQALKEITLTGEYKFAEGFMMRGEYRRDWSNRPYFLTNDLNILKKEQNTATIGLIWWVGRKQGAW